MHDAPLFILHTISSLLIDISGLPQNQQYLCMSNLRTRVAIISQIRK